MVTISQQQQYFCTAAHDTITLECVDLCKYMYMWKQTAGDCHNLHQKLGLVYKYRQRHRHRFDRHFDGE